MKIRYLTNILDPVLGSDKKFRKYVRSVLVSEKYTSSFIKSDNTSADFDFLLSDNGNFTRLSKIASRYKAESEKLDALLDSEFRKDKPLPPSIIKQRKKLNEVIIKACKTEGDKNDYTKITGSQVKINPTGIIGAEDTTIPVLQISGAFDSRLAGHYPALLPFQKNTIKLYTKQCSGGFGGDKILEKVRKYIVVHAIDYDSAIKILKQVKKHNCGGIAMSLGGPLDRKGFLTQVKIGKKIIKFPSSQPESYILSILLLLAFKKIVNKKTPVHILGLGSPILVLLAGYIFKDFDHISIDSTATYADVKSNYIYGNKEGLYKMDLFKVAAYCIFDKTPFKGISPYFKYFEKKYPSNWKKLTSKFKKTLDDKNLADSEKIKLIRKTLETNPSLFLDCIPFFVPTVIAPKKFSKELWIARSFENYWVNYLISNKLSSFKNKITLSNYVKKEIKNFEKYGAKNYVDAVNECVKIIDTHH